MRAEQRRVGRRIRRAERRARSAYSERRAQYVVVTITPELEGFQAALGAALARLESVSGAPMDQLAAALRRFARPFGEPSPRPTRPLIHNGRAPRGRR
jgi:hypothetical protein